MNDTRQIEVLVAHALPDLVSSLLIVLGVAVMLFVINPLLALLTLLPVPLILFVSTRFSRKVAPLFRINQVLLCEINGALQDNLSGMKEIQAFGKEGWEHDKLDAYRRKYAQVNIRANKANGLFHPSVEFLTSLGTVVVVGLGGSMDMGGAIDIRGNDEDGHFAGILVHLLDDEIDGVPILRGRLGIAVGRLRGPVEVVGGTLAHVEEIARGEVPVSAAVLGGASQPVSYTHLFH